MTNNDTNKPHLSFWIIGILALLWNLIGAMNFIGQLNAGFVSTLPETHQAIIEARPIWGTIAFAVAVFGGLLGSVLLLLRKRIAAYLFVASLLGVMIQLIPNFKLAGEVDFPAGELFMMMVMPLLAAAFLAWYASQTQGKGWIK